MTFDEDPSGATQLYNPDDPGAAGEWSVNITEDETRNMPPHEVAYEFLQGNLDAQETFVWREGMGDWIPLGECAELQEVIRTYQNASENTAAAASGAGLGSTVMIDSSQESGAGASAPGLTPPMSDVFAQGDPGPGAPLQEDPQAPAVPSPSQAPGAMLVGERNEASSLFSVDDIMGMSAKAAQGRPKPKPQARSESMDELFSLGGGGGLGGGIADAFAPPPMNAPAPPPPPEPKPEPVIPSAAPAAFAAAQLDEPPRRSKLGLFIGVGAAVVLLVGGAVAFMVSGGDEETVAQNTTGTDTSSSPTDEKSGSDSTADPASDGDEKKDDDDKKDDDKKTDDDKKDDDKKTDDKKTDGKNTVTSTKGTSTGTKKNDKKDDKKDTKKDDKKDDKKAEPAGQFNVNAARSALGGAAGAASGCGKKKGKKRKSRATVTFAPSGRATGVSISGGAAGTSAGSCAANIFRRCTVPPFTGSSQTVGKTFYVKL